MEGRQTTPGLHPKFQLSRFGEIERRILERLAKEWYLTSSGDDIQMGTSTYSHFLMKPVPSFSEMFNIEREIVCVFSPYSNFEPRTLEAISKAQQSHTELRTESVCKLLISKDHSIESKIASLLAAEPEQPIIIPFTYSELDNRYDSFFVRNRFRKHFYSRDLFDFLSPLKSDLYFFGRKQLVNELVNRHRAGEHTSLFGLRKSGKTSIIYAVERALASSGENSISIDCESPSVHKLRWNELLKKIVLLYRQSIGSKVDIVTEGRYTEAEASDNFEDDVLRVHSSKKKRATLFLFDEVERITPKTASSEHWRSGEDFIYFWQTLRSFYQRNPGVFTYMLVGTNPSCVESANLVGHENPIFASIPSQYVPNFSEAQVREMVRKLGRYIGIQFQEIVYSKLAEDFGGHPFLIRQACSVIHRECKSERPVVVDKALYESVKKKFLNSSSQYLDMIIQVLEDWYPDEYEMLKFLAQDDKESFETFANGDVSLTKHLVGYGIVQQSSFGFSFNIELVKEYLRSRHAHDRQNLSSEEMVAEVSRRRNGLERALRATISSVLTISCGRKSALEKVLGSIPEARRKSLAGNSLSELLAVDSSPLFLSDLINILNREWELGFQNVLEVEKQRAIFMFDTINRKGRPDAHAKSIDKQDFAELRMLFRELENAVVRPTP